MASQLTLKQCYDSTGLLRENDVPCDPNAKVSACCGTDGSQCIDNLHCINPAGGSVPGTCTFSSWVSGTEPSCPCPPVHTANQTLDYRDGVTLCEKGGFCCGASNFDCCENGHSKPIIYFGLEGDVIPATESQDPTVALSTYYAGLAVSTQSISRETSSGTASTSATSSGTDSTSAPTTTTSSSSSGSLSTGAKAGIGVGAAAVVVLIIAFVAFFIMNRRRKQRRVAETGTIPAAQPYYDYNQQQHQYQQQQPPPPPPAKQYEKDASPSRPWQLPMELDSTTPGSTERQSHFR